MSVRVVARIRPLLKFEREADIIVRTGSTHFTTSNSNDNTTPAQLEESTTQNRKRQKGGSDLRRDNIVRIPNPKNEKEEYTFQFSAVYDANVGQQEIFDAEVAPTIKHLFSGYDVTLFAYGVTGTGKTHTMRGGKSLADRGVIPRLLSAIFRRSRKIEKETEGATKIAVFMSYYEIYNDKIFDLFEPPEKRTPSGLPLRDNGGKTVVVGLSERPCTSLKEFEVLYDQANANRSTSATKLNAHSSRSHAILCVKLVVTTGDQTRISTASAIDLAGSEDNRRTGNGKERMVESASINKSLFVLAQCVEAMMKKQPRIPYRESKMTRILSLGQNKGITIMILNLAPIRAYHLDTLSSLNFANRTKKIEVKDVENEPTYRVAPKQISGEPSVTGPSIQRQPLRPLTASVNANITIKVNDSRDEKPTKAFTVYTDKVTTKTTMQTKREEQQKCLSQKRRSETLLTAHSRPSKLARVVNPACESLTTLSAAKIEELVQKKVEEILAEKAVNESQRKEDELLTRSREMNEEVQRRLEVLEQRIAGKEDARAEGLSYLVMGKQHQLQGEDASALKMFQLAQPFFPENEKLANKIEILKEKLARRARPLAPKPAVDHLFLKQEQHKRHTKSRLGVEHDSDDDYDDEDMGFSHRVKKASGRRPPTTTFSRTIGRRIIDSIDDQENHTPRTTHILSVINSRNVEEIKLLRGIGTRKAEAIVNCLCEMDNERDATSENPTQVRSLAELGRLKGVGMKTVENMRSRLEL
ncbi:hypothetical protein VTO42DRAFT_7553 [Malbranchea cinnamomea]